MPNVHFIDVTRGLAGSDISCDSYTHIPEGMRFEGACVINCVGTDRGTPDELAKANCDVPQAWASAALARGARQFVQLSSFSVYQETALVHADSKLQPPTAYGRSKLAAEQGLARLAAPDFAVAILRVPILVGSANASAGPTKLGALLAAIRKARVLPLPRPPVERAMLTYGGLGAAVAAIVERGHRGIAYAADPEPFSYDLVSECARVAGMRLFRLPFPIGLTAPLRKLAPGLQRRMFQSMTLAPSLNLLADASGYERLREVITADLAR